MTLFLHALRELRVKTPRILNLRLSLPMIDWKSDLLQPTVFCSFRFLSPDPCSLSLGFGHQRSKIVASIE